jgi:hypothetical protein
MVLDGTKQLALEWPGKLVRPPSLVAADHFCGLAPAARRNYSCTAVACSSAKPGDIPTTIALDQRYGDGGPSHVQAAVYSDVGQIPRYLYQQQHPDTVFDYGFMITGIEYAPDEPHPTPEPATLALLLGAGVMGVRHRLIRSHQ